MAKRLCIAHAFIVGVLLVGSSSLEARASENVAPYFAPEMAYANDLRQTVTVPQKVNINRSSLNQLKVLPAFNEELALKVMRCRPFEGVQDFYRKMPDLGKKNIDLLIQQVQPKVLFK